MIKILERAKEIMANKVLLQERDCLIKQKRSKLVHDIENILSSFNSEKTKYGRFYLERQIDDPESRIHIDIFAFLWIIDGVKKYKVAWFKAKFEKDETLILARFYPPNPDPYDNDGSWDCWEEKNHANGGVTIFCKSDEGIPEFCELIAQQLAAWM